MATVTLGAKKEQEKEITVVDLVDVRRSGDQIMLPEEMSYDQAIAVLQRQKKYEEEEVAIKERIPGFIWDAALAFFAAMEERFGAVNAEAKEGWFGEKTPPQMINVQAGIDKTVSIPWGKFSLPGVVGSLETGVGRMEDGSICLQVTATVKRMYAGVIKDLGQRAREILKTSSIYRSQAVKIDFSEEMPNVSFIDLKDVKVDQLVFSENVQRQIETNLFAPVMKTESVVASGIPLKRGVLLAGKYGTGKTLAAMVTAKIATEHRWTFIYINTPNELSQAISFAKLYEPAIIFAEDIDRAAGTNRDDDVNEILNTLDGILSKNNQIMVVLTTNHVEEINQAMFRPGRLDAIITVDPPDAQAVERLIRNYAGEQLHENEDLTAVGVEMEGKIPAIIRECVERSKLYAISIASTEELRESSGRPKITATALLDAARGMQFQLALLNPQPTVVVHPAVSFAESIVNDVAKKFEEMEINIEQIHTHLI